VIGTATTVLLVVPGVEGALAAAGGAGLAWWRSSHWEGAAERRRRRAVEAEVPLVVDLMVAALQAGSGPAEALERVAEVVGEAAREELQVPLARLRLGADPVSVWGSLRAHPQLHQLGRTLARAAESGAPVADSLQRLSADLRGQRRADVEARIRQVEVKAAAPLGVCFLPAFVLLGVVPLVAGSAVRLVGG
jgi:pilus assembly protein TadC